MGVIAKSEWRGGEQKKLEKLEFDMPINNCSYSTLNIVIVIVVYIHDICVRRCSFC